MDAFTHGMFGELQSYEDRAEFESWIDSTDAIGEAEPNEDEEVFA